MSRWGSSAAQEDEEVFGACTGSFLNDTACSFSPLEFEPACSVGGGGYGGAPGAPPPPPPAKPAVALVEGGGGGIGAVSFVVEKPADIK